MPAKEGRMKRTIEQALFVCVVIAGLALPAQIGFAQPAEEDEAAAEGWDDVDEAGGDAGDPGDVGDPGDEFGEPYYDEYEPAGDAGRTSLTIHVINTNNTYEVIGFDVFDVATEQVVVSGRSVDAGAGEAAPVFDLPPGLYKIVRSGEPFTARVDFATVRVDGPTDYVIVVDATTGGFRGSGVVTGELPEGREIAGIRIALNVGGSLAFNQQAGVVGNTNGINSLVGLFGNFSLVFDRDSHFLRVDSRLQLTVRDPETAGPFSTTDFLQASALYALKINNPYFGPYARVGFQTKIFPGYLYLEADAPTGEVNVTRLDGSVETFQFGNESNADNLRIKLADAFAPLTIQEELGGNLKAVDLDLRLLELSVATRLGFGVRHGIANGLLVVDGDERGTPVNLVEVDNYLTLGPVAGANATVTFARWLFGSGEIGMMVPVKDTDRAGDSFAKRLLIDVSAAGGLKFPALGFFYGSIDYTMRLQRDGYFTSRTQFAHSIMARANLQLF
jgi:hypothetical protein